MIRRPPRSTLFSLHDALPISPPGITTSGYPNVVYYCVNKVEIGRATSELQSQFHLVCRLLLEKKKTKDTPRLARSSEAGSSIAPGLCRTFFNLRLATLRPTAL